MMKLAGLSRGTTVSLDNKVSRQRNFLCHLNSINFQLYSFRIFDLRVNACLKKNMKKKSDRNEGN